MKRKQKVEVYSKRAEGYIEVEIYPNDLPQELYECIGVSNGSSYSICR